MNRRELLECMERLAEDLHFRWANKTKRFYGIHRGIITEIFEWEGEITFTFSSPVLPLEEQAQKGFADFTNVAQAGIPTSWIREPSVSDNDEYNGVESCGLSFDANQVESIGLGTFLQVPDLVIDDLHALGADQTLPCVNCGDNEATTLAQLDYTYNPMCDDCWRDLQFHTSGGKLQTEQSVNWLFVVPALTTLTVVGGVLWGLIQQPQNLKNFGLISMILPVAWAFGLCYVTCFISGGVTLIFRISLFASVITSVLAGNIWGFRSAVIEQMKKQFDQVVPEFGWIEFVELYFTQFPAFWEDEVPFLIGGVLGAWIGLRFMKSAESIQVH